MMATREYLAALVEAERYGVPSAASAGTAAGIRARIAAAIEAERHYGTRGLLRIRNDGGLRHS